MASPKHHSTWQEAEGQGQLFLLIRYPTQHPGTFTSVHSEGGHTECNHQPWQFLDKTNPLPLQGTETLPQERKIQATRICQLFPEDAGRVAVPRDCLFTNQEPKGAIGLINTLSLIPPVTQGWGIINIHAAARTGDLLGLIREGSETSHISLLLGHQLCSESGTPTVPTILLPSIKGSPH